MKRVSVLGLGYIGLPTAIIAAENGYNVLGFDIDSEKVSKINSYVSPILEPEISTRMQNVLDSKTFRAYDQLQEADCFVIAVPTPFKEGKKADLTYVWRAGAMVASVLKKNNLVILESTVPVGTTDKFASIIGAQSGLKPNVDFFVAHCPERVIPGKIFEELKKNDRVIGGISTESSNKAKEFYTSFVEGNLFITTANTAEMTKLVENASRDVQIAFAHQLSSMCERVTIDVHEVIELANKHPRVNILSPTCGVGGHCIAVDPWFLIEQFPQETDLLKAARKINDLRPKEVAQKILAAVDSFKVLNFGKKPTLLVLGLSYKPDVNDLRESPALEIAHILKSYSKSQDLIVCEPHTDETYFKDLGFVCVNDWNLGIIRSDIIVFLVNHSIFANITDHILESKIVIDSCGFFNKTKKITEDLESFSTRFIENKNLELD